jgi:hypothetical protein
MSGKDQILVIDVTSGVREIKKANPKGIETLPRRPFRIPRVSPTGESAFSRKAGRQLDAIAQHTHRGGGSARNPNCQENEATSSPRRKKRAAGRRSIRRLPQEVGQPSGGNYSEGGQNQQKGDRTDPWR